MHSPCSSCHGSGCVYRNTGLDQTRSGWVPCAACKGTGQQPPSVEERLAALEGRTQAEIKELYNATAKLIGDVGSLKHCGCCSDPVQAAIDEIAPKGMLDEMFGAMGWKHIDLPCEECCEADIQMTGRILPCPSSCQTIGEALQGHPCTLVEDRKLMVYERIAALLTAMLCNEYVTSDSRRKDEDAAWVWLKELGKLEGEQ